MLYSLRIGFYEHTTTSQMRAMIIIGWTRCRINCALHSLDGVNGYVQNVQNTATARRSTTQHEVTHCLRPNPAAPPEPAYAAYASHSSRCCMHACTTFFHGQPMNSSVLSCAAQAHVGMHIHLLDYVDCITCSLRTQAVCHLYHPWCTTHCQSTQAGRT